MHNKREFYFQFHINRSCNLRCRHCYQRDYDHAATVSAHDTLRIADSILDASKRWNVLARVSLTGGEPFLSEVIWAILEKLELSDHVVRTAVLTNGTLIDDGIARRLHHFAKLGEVQVSLDGATSATHDAIRGRGAYDAALRGIRFLKRAGLSVSIMFSLSDCNAREATDVLELARQEHVDYVTIERVVPTASSSLAHENGLTPEQLKAVYTRVHAWAESQTRDDHYVHVRRHRPLWVLVSEGHGGFCPVGFTCLAILDDGTILPCRRLEFPIGNALSDGGLYKAWYTSPVLWRIRNKQGLRGKCHECVNVPRCGGCRAVAYSVTGCYMEGDPQCWQASSQC